MVKITKLFSRIMSGIGLTMAMFSLYVFGFIAHDVKAGLVSTAILILNLGICIRNEVIFSKY